MLFVTFKLYFGLLNLEFKSLDHINYILITTLGNIIKYLGI